MYRYILFDLDGTLTDPKEGITKCVQYALQYFGIEADTEDLVDFIGPPLLESFQKYYQLDDAQGHMALKKYRERFKDIGIFENGVYPGIHTLLSDLKKQGRSIALATSMPYFDVVVGSEMDGRRTDKGEVITEALRQLQVADGQRQEVLMIGDRLHDMIGAGKNHVDKLGVYYGYAHEGELEEAGADYTVCTVEELYDFFKAH